MNNFLIPANSKKSQLIFNFFTVTDLIVFSIGALFTIILLVAFETSNITRMYSFTYFWVFGYANNTLPQCNDIPWQYIRILL